MEIKHFLQKTRTVSLMIIRAVRIKWFESYVAYTDVSGKIASSFFLAKPRLFFGQIVLFILEVRIIHIFPRPNDPIKNRATN